MLFLGWFCLLIKALVSFPLWSFLMQGMGGGLFPLKIFLY